MKRALALVLAPALALTAACHDGPGAPSRPARQSTPEELALVQRLQELHEGGRHDEGIALAQEALREDPGTPLLHYVLGVLLGSRDDHRAAIPHFERELERDPAHYESWRGLSVAHTRLGELERALAALETCRRLRPQDREMAFQLGRNLSTLGRLDEAEPHLREALAEPTAERWTELGLLHRRRGQTAEAARAFERALVLAPDHPAALLNLGQALVRLGHRERGEALLDRHARAAPLEDRLRQYEHSSRLPGATAGNFLLLGQAQLARHRPADAARSFRRALELDARSLPAALGLAGTALELGDLQEATQWAVHALQIDAESSHAYFLLGLLRIRRGQAEAAPSVLAESRRRAPWTATNHLHLGDAYLQNGNLGEALAAYREAARLAPADGRPHLGLGKALLHGGDAAGAAGAFARAAKLAPADPGPRLARSAALFALGRREEGERELRAAETLEPLPGALRRHAAGMDDLPGASDVLALLASRDPPSAKP